MPGSSGVRSARWTVIALVLLVPGVAAAQQPSNAEPLRTRVSASLGALVYRTGDVNCEVGAGPTGGIEVRTRHRWLLTVLLDGTLAGPAVCTSMLPTTTYGGQSVEVWTGTAFAAAPRVGARAGGLLSHSLPIEATVGGGYWLLKANLAPEAEWLVRPWLGGTIAYRAGGVLKRLQFEYGQFASPVRYQQGNVVVHRFDQREPFYRLVFAF